MLVALLIVGLGVLAAQVVTITGGFLIYRRVTTAAREWVTAPSEGELSPVAQVTHAMAQDFARTLFLQLKQHLAAPATHITRQENAIVEETTGAALAEAAPGWSALLGLLPKNVQKRVLGNPSAAMALVGLLGKGGFGSGAGGAPGDNGTTKSSVQLRLQNLH